ncbi:MAG: hypothetical protein Q9202_005926 [Teloschistes flavicans]
MDTCNMGKPIFVVTHSRSCSTAFERVFITRRDILSIHHEPFGDPFYYGPEKISPASQRWPSDKITRSGKSHYTYDLVLQNILKDAERLFIKDISYHIIPPIHSPNVKPPSLQRHFGHNDPPNPTLLPTPILASFRFVFLIRDPSAAVPSLHRCFLPPLSAKTEDYYLDPAEFGYRELRILFDYLYPSNNKRSTSEVGESDDKPLLIDAEDLLANPSLTISTLCNHVGIPFSPTMLEWPGEEDHDFAFALFEKYAGYHEDALNSTYLRPAAPRPRRSKEGEDAEWKENYGDEAAKHIRTAVDACRNDYEYLRGFRLKISDQ